MQPPLAFEVPTWALRVNGLWFASLIVSLSTASFGMLVKSWLREYLAVSQVAPQLRLRVRQYRYPGLQKWKVFEIAAALPLLLQVALGLFFVGLCFFTAQIESRMGLTSLPLVSGWAFFLVLTTIAPLISPRCPFKLLLLKRTLKWGRRWVRPGALYLASTLSRFYHYVLNLRNWAVIVMLSNFMTYLQSLFPLLLTLKELSKDEEDNVIAGSQEDTEILLLTDTMSLDDGLLNAMLEALQQTHPSPSIVVDFVIRLICNRIPQYGEIISSGHLSVILDLSVLSRQAYVTIMEMVIEALTKVSQPLSSSSPLWIKDAILLLMSSSRFPLPDNAYPAIAKCINDDDYDSPAGVEFGRYLKESAKEHSVLQRFSSMLLPICDTRYISNWSSILQIYNVILENIMQVEPRLIQTMQKHNNLADNIAAQELLQCMWILLFAAAKADSTIKTSYPGSDNCIYITMTLAHNLDKLKEFAPVYGRWWINGNVYRALNFTASLSPQYRITDELAWPITYGVFENVPLISKLNVLIMWKLYIYWNLFIIVYAEMLGDTIIMLHGYMRGKFVDIDIVHLCVLYLKLYKVWQVRCASHLNNDELAKEEGQVQELWVKLWETMSQTLKYYWNVDGWTRAKADNITHKNINLPELSHSEYFEKDQESAMECLRIIEEIKQNDRMFAELPSIKFSSELYRILGIFVSSSSGNNFSPELPIQLSFNTSIVMPGHYPNIE